MKNKIFGGIGPLHKQDLVERLSTEIKDCKQRRQSNIWTFWHYAENMMQFADTNKQFRMIKDLWTSQGFRFSETRRYPEVAKLIGASSVIAHVWKNTTIKEGGDTNMTEPMSILMGYMNASDETVTWEINV